MAELIVAGLNVQAADKMLVDDVSMRVGAGELVALVGPNGAGKSSLLRAVAGVQPYRGSIGISGRDGWLLSPLERARLLSWLPQSHPPAWPVTVRAAVAIGRYAWGGGLTNDAEAHVQAIDAVIAQCDLAALADRRITSLSGGELARVHLARALAAQAPLLLADEPVAALDPAHRLSVMRILRSHANAGGAVLLVLHDIGLAARYADRVIGMRDGKMLVDGAPEKVVTAELMERLFDVAADVRIIDGAPVPIATAPIA